MIFHRVKKLFRPDWSKPGISHSVPGIIKDAFGYDINRDGQEEKIKIDILVQDGKSLPKSSAFIRLIAPLTNPLIADQVSLNMSEDLSDFRENVQIIIVQRAVLTSMDEAQKIIRLVENKDIKLIVDTDDAFFSLDRNHPNYEEFHSRHDALLYLVKKADQLWVSTDNLRRHYQKISKTPVHVISNTLDARIWKRENIKKMPPESPLKLLYMGTATHEEDFKMITPWLDKMYKKYPKSFELHIIGVSSNLPGKPWLKSLKRGPDTVIYPNFTRWIQSEGPFDIGLAPLVDSVFNKYKSDIKCLDYLAIGAIPMVSKVDPYSNKDLADFIFLNSNTEKAWVESLEKIILDLPGFRHRRLRILELSQNYIWQKRSSKIAAKQIARLLKIN